MSALPLPKEFEEIRGKRILVTGGTGFLGQHLLERLSKLETHIFALSRPSSNLEKISHIPGVEITEAELSQASQVTKVAQYARPQIIFHLAAYGVNPKCIDVKKIVRTNIQGLENLLDSLNDIPFERFVNTGTCFEFGNQKEPLSESAPLSPLNAYAASKMMAWHLCHAHFQNPKKPVVTLRPFTFYGPHERFDRLVPSTILSILKDEEIRITSGTQTRDYTYVEDMVEAFLLASVKKQAIGQTFNIGSGQDYTVQDIVHRIRALMESEVPIQAGAIESRAHEAWRLCSNPTKIQALLGWQPRIAFDEGLMKTIDWIKKHHHMTEKVK
jgi:nucleoside-diphosphate-sugar epimerase